MFLGDPCPCGWAFDPVSEKERLCECCGRKYVYKGFWIQVTDRMDIKCSGLCAEKRRKQGRSR